MHQNLLNGVMTVEIALLVVAVIIYFSHGLWLFINHRRIQRSTEAARESLARLVTRGTINVEDIALLRALRHDVQESMFLEMSAI